MRISEHVFEGQDVVVDFHHFDHCCFKDCRLIVHGVGGFHFFNCEIIACDWQFRGPAAVTLRVLGQLYQSGFATIVERTLAEIWHPPKHS